MEYAPVIIPTLNRYNHLKRCIDSLAQNPLAKYTELIISVDYPPNNKYEEGYLKVKEILNTYDFSCFKSTDITYQKSNLGAQKNSTFLFEKAKCKSNVVIYSEDDNEFAINFLDYINKTLSKFNDDPNVVFICGAIDANWICPSGSNITKTKLCPSYGIGVWIDRREKFIKEGSQFLLDKKNWTMRNFCLLFKRNRFLFSKYICEILLCDHGLYWYPNGSLNFCDVPKAIYMHLTDYSCISPSIPVSRTFGNDGSGVNMPALKSVLEIKLDTDTSFELLAPSSLQFINDNYYIGESYFCEQYLNGKRWANGILLSIVGSFVLFIIGKDRQKAIKIMNFIYGIFKKKYNK